MSLRRKDGADFGLMGPFKERVGVLAALAYIATVMLLMARPIIAYFFWHTFHVESESGRA